MYKDNIHKNHTLFKRTLWLVSDWELKSIAITGIKQKGLLILCKKHYEHGKEKLNNFALIVERG